MAIDTILTLDLRPESGVPLHRQVYAQIRMAILAGRVRSHQKLPSSRQLAQSLGISRTTVTASYDQLISEGYLETRHGAGT
ncbi:MAG: winged helix-turn-helix domain-containing protein, partial [Phormidesmis sp.]